MTKFAFDLRGVIVNKDDCKISDETIKTINMTVQKFKPENVYIISKAKEKWIEINKKRLADIDFFNRTGMIKENVYFVDEYEDKGILCKKLGIDYMIDDSVKVLRYLECNSFWFGVKHNAQTITNTVIPTPQWKTFRKKIEKISS